MQLKSLYKKSNVIILLSYCLTILITTDNRISLKRNQHYLTIEPFFGFCWISRFLCSKTLRKKILSGKKARKKTTTRGRFVDASHRRVLWEPRKKIDELLMSYWTLLENIPGNQDDKNETRIGYWFGPSLDALLVRAAAHASVEVLLALVHLLSLQRAIPSIWNWIGQHADRHFRQTETMILLLSAYDSGLTKHVLIWATRWYHLVAVSCR